MDKVTIDGTSYPCRVTMGAMRRFEREVGHDVQTLKGISEIGVWLWACVASACKADGIEFDYDCDTFADMVDVDTMTNFANAMTAQQKKMKDTNTPVV